MKIWTLALTGLLFGAAAQGEVPWQNDDEPDVTEEGLVRVPSGAKVGVYRLPVATFNQYQNVMFGPTEVVFKKGWEREHKELTKKDRDALRGQLASLLRSELVKELVDRGGYRIAKEPTTDTLLVKAHILQVDVTAPKASMALDKRTFVSSAGSMKVVVELHDAASGVLIGRLINYEMAPDRGDQRPTFNRPYWPPPATEINTLADFRVGFETSARYTHEALSVARSAKREDQSQMRSEN